MIKNVTRIKSEIMIKVDVSAKIQKNVIICEKGYTWHPSTCSCENGKYLVITIENSVITYDEIINDADSISTNITSTVSKTFITKK